MAATFVKGVDLSPNGLAMDALLTNEPGTHFMGNAHTLQNFETAFYRSTTANNDSFEQWQEQGSLTAEQRANAVWKKRLAEYDGPGIDPGVDEALLDYIARRKASFPDSDA